MATSKSTPHAPADAVTHSPVPGYTGSVTMLPTAATEPVMNPKRRGRYPRNIVPLWKIRNMRLARAYDAACEHAASLHPGLIVKVCDRDLQNFGRLCRTLYEDGRGYWVVEALAGELILPNDKRSNMARFHFQSIEPQGAPRRSVR